MTGRDEGQEARERADRIAALTLELATLRRELVEAEARARDEAETRALRQRVEDAERALFELIAPDWLGEDDKSG